MSSVLDPLTFAARHARLVLVVGLIVGTVIPPLALSVKPWLPELVSCLLFLAALRIGLNEASGRLADTPFTLGLIALFQLALPLSLIMLFRLVDWNTPLSTGLVLMASAASISGSPNICVLTGNNPSAALRLLVVGTALLPATVVPVFALLPQLGSADMVFSASINLFLIIAGTTLAGFAIRRVFIAHPNEEQLAAIDGVSSLTMAVMVVGLMSAMGPSLVATPWTVVLTLAVAFIANYGLQVLSFLALSAQRFTQDRVAFSVVAGNRNMALFLSVLPLSITDPVLLFVACYQVPMFLTPVFLSRLYKPER